MNNRIRTLIFIGITTVLATGLILMLVHPTIYLSTTLGICFLVYSEIVFFSGLISIEYLSGISSGIIVRSGLGVTISVYSIVVFISSLIYMNLHTAVFNGFLILQIVFIVIMLINCLIFVALAKSKAVNDNRTLNSDIMINNFANELFVISEKDKRMKDVKKIADLLRYSDSSVVVDVDVEINDMIEKLKNLAGSDKQDNGIDEIIKRLDFLVKKRNLQTKMEKGGGI